MCYEWEEEVLRQRIDEARKEAQKDPGRAKPGPAAPAAPAPEPAVKDDELVPV